jgi:hypothetical protein
MYILAWFPGMGFFPLTRMSVLEMNQIAPLLGIAVVAMIREFRPVWKARHFGRHFSQIRLTSFPLYFQVIGSYQDEY